MELFAPPVIEARHEADGSILLTARERLGPYPKTVPAMLRSWASTDPEPGVPLPGAEVKLVPHHDAYEIRVRGPMVTPGYLQRADLTAQAFDAQGFYQTGDAVEFATAGDPAAGPVFRGRIAEDFKLATGTFVRVGAVRTALLAASPLLSDAVIVGEGRDSLGALAWLNTTEAASAGETAGTGGDFVVDPDLARRLAAALAEVNTTAGSAARIERILILAQPPDLEAGEITDKGYVNQRMVITNRPDAVEQLYAADRPPAVIVAAASRP